MTLSRETVAAFGICALFVGLSAAWPMDGATAGIRAISYSGVTFGVLVFFLAVLPPRLGLPSQVFIAMVSGSVFGWLSTLTGSEAFVSDYLGILGTLFILLLKVVIIPLIFVSVLCGVAGVGDIRKLGSLGVKTIVYFLSTTALAVVSGIVLVQLLHPGIGRESLREIAQKEETAEVALSLGQRIQQEILPAVIQNPIMAGQSPIVIIFMALLLGAALASLGEKGEPALKVFKSLDDAFVAIIGWVMLLAPAGVFALMARVIAELGVGYMVTLAKYCGTVLGGLTLHFLVVTCLLVPLLAHMRPMRFLRAMAPAFQLAFSTSSSNATLPVNMDCVIRRAGADPNIAGFVLPIGATVNMDGTALYVSVASIFIGQVYGIDLTLQQQFMVFLTAVLVSVGTAGIPGASVGLISIILTAVGIPVEGLAIVIGVDRLLDMSRTVVNITGDAAGAVILSHGEGKLRPAESS